MLARPAASSIAPTFILALACSSSEPKKEPAVPAAPPAAEVPSIRSSSYEAPAPWATPIVDYIAAGDGSQHKGKFAKGIHDLIAFGGRLHLAYGDGTYNLGEIVPIEFRSFGSPDDPNPRVDFKSDEEQIDRFRVIDGELFQAGVDATDPDELSVRPLIVGNVYRHRPEGWTKYRKVPGGEHVHDVAWFDGALYAVGSGAANRSEWEKGKIFRYLWRSDARGDGFEVAHRMKNELGDTRWVHLLPRASELLVFGYETKNEVNVIANAHLAAGGAAAMLPDDHVFRKIAAFDVEQAPGGGGILRGMDLAVAEADRKPSAWFVPREGAPAELTAFAGQTLADVSYVPDTKEVLLLTFDGADASKATYAVSIYAAPDAEPNSAVPVARFETPSRPRAIAWFQGSIFYGNDAGEVWRARRR